MLKQNQHRTKEVTFVMIKPDGVARGLIGEIVGRIERKGLKIACMTMVAHASRLTMESHYQHLKDKPFFHKLVDSGTAGPLVKLAVCGLNSIKVMRALLGSTAGFDAAPGTIRGDLSCSQRNNLIHASDSAENASREIALWFSGPEVDTGVMNIDLYHNPQWNYSAEERE